MPTLEKRSESDVLQKILKLTFGGKEYEVPVLRMRESAKWRQQYFERTREVSTSMIVDNLNDKAELSNRVGNALTAALLKFPEKIPDLVFSYAISLLPQREEIEADAYDEDFSLAFAKIWQVAFQPFLASLGTMLEMQRAQDSHSVSSANSN